MALRLRRSEHLPARTRMSRANVLWASPGSYRRSAGRGHSITPAPYPGAAAGLAPHHGPFAAPYFHRHSPQAEHRVITEPTSCEPQIGISCATSILSGFMERVQTKAWLPKVRKGLVEANRRFLAEQVDPFTTGNSQRFFDKRTADPTTAMAGADSEVREKCLELPVTEQLRESDDVAPDHGDNRCDAGCRQDPQRASWVIRK